MGGRRITLRILPPVPFGEVTIVPAALGERPDADMARAMTTACADIEAPTVTGVLNRLRQSFPLAPLQARMVALGLIMERLRRARFDPADTRSARSRESRNPALASASGFPLSRE